MVFNAAVFRLEVGMIAVPAACPVAGDLSSVTIEVIS
jgi:hypothetical protein